MSDSLSGLTVLPGVPEAVDQAREAVDRLLAERILIRRGAEVSLESALRGARASAALEGADVPLSDLRSGSVTNPLVNGALRVSAEIGLARDTWAGAPRQVLARLHALAAAGQTSAANLGRPRADTRAADPLGLGPACSAAQVSGRLDALVEVVLNAPTDIPALVVAAVVHGELVTVRPFGFADGIVARAAERLTLVQRGLDPRGLVAPEVGHAESRSAYATAVRAYQAGTTAGMATWIGHCARAVVLGARDCLAVAEALRRS